MFTKKHHVSRTKGWHLEKRIRNLSYLVSGQNKVGNTILNKNTLSYVTRYKLCCCDWLFFTTKNFSNENLINLYKNEKKKLTQI